MDEIIVREVCSGQGLSRRSNRRLPGIESDESPVTPSFIDGDGYRTVTRFPS
jgi:hypothetical protein